jgi:NAD(P)H-hydrate epimerase
MISCSEMKELDRYAIEVIGIPSIVLMENAALKVVKNISPKSEKIVLVCGIGNNGGDGLAVARHLYLCGREVAVYLLGDPEGGTVDFKINLNILRNLNIEAKRIVEGNVLEDLRKSIQGSDLIVDAIFGIGISREVTGLYRKAIEIINESGKPVISVDIPSGLNGDTGDVMGVSVNAHKTITFHRVKTGLVNAMEHTGEVIVEKIGIPERG